MFNEINSIFLDFDGTITKQDTVNSLEHLPRLNGLI